MSKLTPEESLNLKKLISEYDAEDNTEHIRRVKHSIRIRDDIEVIERTKREKSELRKNSPDEFRELLQNQASFLFTNYTDIFNRILKDELNLDIMYKFLIILKMVEDGRCSQHEGSVAIGKLLKELYIDSAVRAADNLDQKYKEEKKQDDSESHETREQREERNISWHHWRKRKEEITANLVILKENNGEK